MIDVIFSDAARIASVVVFVAACCGLGWAGGRGL